MNLKLAESWEGPFTVTKKNSPLSYSIDTGDRKIPSVHVQLIKKYQKAQVGRVTSVFQQDTTSDNIVDRYSEASVQTQELRDSQNKDIQELVDRYKDVLTSEPGLTHLADLG